MRWMISLSVCLAFLIQGLKLRGEFSRAIRVFGEQQLDHVIGVRPCAGGVQPRRDAEGDWPRSGTSPVAKPATSKSAAHPGLRSVPEALQTVFHEDAVLAGERHHVGHRPMATNFNQRSGSAAAFLPATPNSPSSACASLKATPAPQRFLSG